MTRCRFTILGYKIGRAVQEQTRCKRNTSHPSGLCWQHRSDSVTEGRR